MTSSLGLLGAKMNMIYTFFFAVSGLHQYLPNHHADLTIIYLIAFVFFQFHHLLAIIQMILRRSTCRLSSSNVIDRKHVQWAWSVINPQIYSWLNRSHFYQFHGINYNSLWQNLGPYEIKCSRNTYIWDQINFFFMAKPVVRFYMSGLEGSRVIMSCDYPKASYQFRIYYFSSFSKKKLLFTA